jgi:hypothetical protein
VKKSTDFEKIAHLIPLRVTDDLSTEEAKQVDETIRYDDQSRSELHSFQQIMGVLQGAASSSMRNESSVVRGESSLWDRIEPRLGPVVRPKPSLYERIPTGYLAIAAGLLMCVTALTEFGAPLHRALPVAMTQGWRQGNVQTVASETAVGGVPVAASNPNVNVRVNVAVPIAGESIGIPALGLVVTRVERVVQRVMGLQDLNAVLITEVAPNSFADRCGFKKGDCLVRVDQQRIYAPLHAVEVLNAELADGKASFEVIRAGQKVSVAADEKTDHDQSLRIPDESTPAIDLRLSA